MYLPSQCTGLETPSANNASTVIVAKKTGPTKVVQIRCVNRLMIPIHDGGLSLWAHLALFIGGTVCRKAHPTHYPVID